MLLVLLILSIPALHNRVQAVCFKWLVVSSVLYDDEPVRAALNLVKLAWENCGPDNLGILERCSPLAFHLVDAEVEDQ